MNYIILSFLIAVISISCENAVIQEVENEETNKFLLKEEDIESDNEIIKNDPEDISDLFYRDEISKIRLVSYKMENNANLDEYTQYQIRKTDLNTKISLENFAEIIILDNNQIKDLKKILPISRSTEPEAVEECYIPHHCFHFLNNNDVLLDYLEICFICHKTVASHESLNLFTSHQLRKMEYFVKKCGIKKGFK